MRTINTAAPTVTLTTLTGQPAPLADAWHNQHALLIFLRHLGCLPCRDHVAQLRDHTAELAAMHTAVTIISFGTTPLAEQWLTETGAHFTFLLDPTRAAYHAYGLERSVLRTWGWRNLSYYARQLLTGRKLRGIQGDAHQLGGDFIVDSTGIIRLAHPSHDPTDRPTPAELFATLRTLPHPATQEVSSTP